jgi:uncharacterized iron-regulated membrane protein
MYSSRVRQWPGYGAIWRWHFYAGLFCIPFILWLACTGSIYLWKPQVERLLDRPFAHVADGLRLAPPSRIAVAAERVVSGSIVHAYQLPEMQGQAVQVIVGNGERETRVYVDPANLKVLKAVDEDERLMETVERLHGELLLGKKGSYIVELAASWAIVMILTGLALWWPRGGGLAGTVYPRLRSEGRRFWRDLHSVMGFWLSIFALGFLVSGLPWAASWGAYLQAVRSLTAEGLPDWDTGSAEAARGRARNDAALRKSAASEHGAMAGMDMPGMAAMSGMAAPSAPETSSSLAYLDRVVPAAAALRLPPPVLVSPPSGNSRSWSARSDTQDRPLRSEVRIDGSGKIISASGFGDRPAIDRAVDYGVAAHEGQLFGLANQLLNLAIALGLIALSVSGFIMWWKRKPQGSLGAPRQQAPKPLVAIFILGLGLLGILLPMLGLSILAVLAAESLVLSRIPAARRWLGFRPAAA